MSATYFGILIPHLFCLYAHARTHARARTQTSISQLNMTRVAYLPVWGTDSADKEAH